eukprot:UN28759
MITTYAEQRRQRGKDVSIRELKNCFKQVDQNGDNQISFNEFCTAIDVLGIEWELETARTAFKSMDEDGNKSLDWYEFSHGVHIVNPSVHCFWNNTFLQGKKDRRCTLRNNLNLLWTK